MKFTICAKQYASIKYTALFCVILALLNLLGAKQANYASCRHYKNLRVEIGQNAYIFTSFTYNIYLSNNKKAGFSKLVFDQPKNDG